MSDQTRDSIEETYDVVIVGAGFAGLRLLWEMRQRGLSAHVIEAGSDVGGTWYWNRYPGARSDSDSWAYCYWFDKDLQNDWDWSQRFPQQPEIHSYLAHVADRFDMRKDITFDTRVDAAHYDADANRWNVQTNRGDRLTCTYLLCGTGLLSIPNKTPFKGTETFKGEQYQPARWPKEGVDFTGKRVAVIGTGATGVQIIPLVAHSAEHLTVFQRTPNYVMPGRNYLLHDEERQWLKSRYAEMWELAQVHGFGAPMEHANRVRTDMNSPAEHQDILEAGWEAGGFRFFFETFDDLLIDQTSNDLAAEFVRHKIRIIVKDPETAEKLCPEGYPLGGKRPPLGHFYYETFNRPNVSLVSIKDNAIAEVTPTGIKLEDGTEHEVDAIIYALGFDAITGAMSAMDIRGADGQSIADEWKDWPNNFLGVSHPGFPNLFSVLGPGGPFSNAPVTVEKQSEWIGEAIAHARAAGTDFIEPSRDAAEAWVAKLDAIIEMTILGDGSVAGGAWYIGANIPGKKTFKSLQYWGGAGAYYGELQGEIDSGFEHFSTEPRRVASLDAAAG